MFYCMVCLVLKNDQADRRDSSEPKPDRRYFLVEQIPNNDYRSC